MIGGRTGWGWEARGKGMGGRRWSQRALRIQAGVLILVLLGLCIFGPSLLKEMSEERPGIRFASPSAAHPWGTDHEGRDMFVRVAVSSGSTGVILLGLWMVAVVLGTVAGLARAIVPGVLQRVIDALYRAWDCFPMLLLAAVLVIMSGWAGPNVVFVLGGMGAVIVSRGVGDVLNEAANHPSYRAAIATCASRRSLWRYYRLPHALRAGVHASWGFLASALIWESSLAFVSPTTAISSWSLGSLMREGSPYLMDAPGLALFPALALFVIRFVILIFESASASEFERYRSLLRNE